MIMYTNLNAAKAMRHGIERDYSATRRGLRLVAPTDHAAE